MTAPALLDADVPPLVSCKTCGRELTDAVSRARLQGDVCYGREYGHAPSRVVPRQSFPGPAQDVLPLDLSPDPDPQAPAVDPASWPLRIVGGQVVCARPGCTAVLTGVGTAWTLGDVGDRLNTHAPDCAGEDPQPALEVLHG
jgi:hypothetical protein